MNNKNEKNQVITPRIDMKNRNKDVNSEVVQTATFGKGEEFTSFNGHKPNYSPLNENEGSPNRVNKMRSVNSTDTNDKQNEVFVSFFNDINHNPKINSDKTPYT